MGLDTVELLMDIENYFGIEITGPEAEKVSTIETMVDIIAKKLHVPENGSTLKNKMLQKISAGISLQASFTKQVNPSDYISLYLSPDNKESWYLFKNTLALKVPEPAIFKTNSGKLSDKLKGLFYQKINYDWETITVDQFTTAICAVNYETLIDKNNIRDTYEIYIAVTGITVDKTGIDYYEITPEKSFTNDLGMD